MESIVERDKSLFERGWSRVSLQSRLRGFPSCPCIHNFSFYKVTYYPNIVYHTHSTETGIGKTHFVTLWNLCGLERVDHLLRKVLHCNDAKVALAHVDACKDVTEAIA